MQDLQKSKPHVVPGICAHLESLRTESSVLSITPLQGFYLKAKEK